MKIAVIGKGNVGRSVAELLAKAGHAVQFGIRNPVADPALAGPVSSVEEAAAFGDVALCATPYGIWPDLAREIASFVEGKIVIDAANPYPARDGEFAQHAIDAGEGAGVPVAALLPKAKLVRAFNCVPWPAMVAEAGRAGERIAIPLAGDEASARELVAGLIKDAGFDPVDAGALRNARAFDPGGQAYNHPMPAVAMRQMLKLI